MSEQLSQEQLSHSAERINKPSFCENLGVWAAKRFLNYLNTLGPDLKKEDFSDLTKRSEKPYDLRRRRSKAYLNYGIPALLLTVLAGAWGTVLYAQYKQQLSSAPKPAATVTSLNPDYSKSLYRLIQTLEGKGSSVTFPYGAVRSEVAGLTLQIDPVGLGTLLERTNLAPPEGSAVATIITPEKKEAEEPLILLPLQQKLEREQGKTISVMTGTSLPLYEILSAGNFTSQEANLRLTSAWLRLHKSKKGLLATGFRDNAALTLSESGAIRELAVLPFRLLKVP